MIECFIQHHPARTDLLPALIRSTGLPTTVVTDDGPLPANPWRGYKLCLEAVVHCNAQHGVVIQDDALLCENFGPAITRIAQFNNDTPVVLFLAALPKRTSRDALKATKQGLHYVTLFSRDFCPVVGMLWPKTKALELLEWAETAPLPGGYEPRSDDAVVGRWKFITKQTVVATIPSLVQHPDEVPSLIGRKAHWGKDKGRIAQNFCLGDPLEIDWSRPQSRRSTRR